MYYFAKYKDDSFLVDLTDDENPIDPYTVIDSFDYLKELMNCKTDEDLLKKGFQETDLKNLKEELLDIVIFDNELGTKKFNFRSFNSLDNFIPKRIE
jgi:hypothetical protein